MLVHHLMLILDNTKLLFLSWKVYPLKNLSVKVDNSTMSPSKCAKNLGVTLDNTLLFSANIKEVTRSCRFILYNIRRVQPYLNLPMFSHVTPFLRTLL